MVDEVAIGVKFRALAGEFNERQRRLWAASEARAAGRGGIAATARATGMAVDTIRKGIGELESGESIGAGRVRKPGAGRKPLSETDPKLLVDLEQLVEGDRRGDPESLLLWTSKSVRHLAGGLRERTRSGPPVIGASRGERRRDRCPGESCVVDVDEVGMQRPILAAAGLAD